MHGDDMYTSIRVHKETIEKLRDMRLEKESLESVIMRLWTYAQRKNHVAKPPPKKAIDSPPIETDNNTTVSEAPTGVSCPRCGGVGKINSNGNYVCTNGKCSCVF